MTDSEKLDFIVSEMQGMKSEMQGMKSDMQEMKLDIQEIKSDMQGMNDRMDNLELQVKQTERTLRDEIRRECSLVLDEVERVHILFEKHRTDSSVHTA